MDLIKYDMTDIWAVAGDVVAPDSSKVRAGWGVEVVPRQWWNWFENRQDNNIAYMLQKGFPEWDSTTQYIINKSYVQRNGVVYRATATSTNSDPIALTAWVKAFVDSTPFLEAIKSLAVTPNTQHYIDGSGVAQNAASSSFGRQIGNVADAAAARTLISAQAAHANLTGLSGVAGDSNNLPYFTGSGNMGVTTFTGFARTLLSGSDAAAMRTTLGLGTAALSNVTTSNTDTTAGRLLKVGDFGVGSPVLLPNTDLNTLINSGEYYCSGSLVNSPAGVEGWLRVAGINSSYCTQYFTQVASGATYIRVLNASVWSAWDSAIRSNSGITTLPGQLNVGGAINEAPRVSLASAATVNIGAAAANTLTITGTTTITAFDTVADGIRRRMVFSGALTLTNSAALALPNATNIVTAANDTAEFVSLGGGNWRCLSYSRYSGQPLSVVSVAQGGTGVTTSTGTGSTVLSASPALTGSPTAPTQSVSDNSTKIASTAYVSNQIASSMLGSKNRIINGDCRLSQRGASFVASNNTFGYGGPDRFYAANTAAGGQFTQSSGTLVDGSVTKNCVTQTVNSVATDLTGTKLWTGVVQYIEGSNSYDLIGQAVTLSFLFKASFSGTYSVAVRDSSAAYSYITTFTATANVVQRVIVNLPAIPTGASIPNSSASGLGIWIGAQNNGTYATSTLNTWQNSSYICATPTAFWALQSGATISVGDLQLEVGTAATPFEHRSMAHEALLCQRYYQNTTVGWIAYQVAGNGFGTYVSHAVPMRATPTVVFTPATVTNVTGAGVSASDNQMFNCAGTATATGTVVVTGSATFSAEL
jgi:hypothetical protein